MNPKLLLCVAWMLLVPLAHAESVRLAGHRIFVPLQINGVTTQALLDSGAEITLVDAAFAEELSLKIEGSEVARGTGGEQPVRFSHGLEIESAGVRLTGLSAAVLDLTDVSRRLVGEPLTVVLGREFFDAGRYLLDFSTGRLEAVPPEHIPAGVKLPLRDHAGIKQMPVAIEGVATWADVDLGNGSEMLLGHGFATAQGWLEPGRVVGHAAGGGLGGEVQRQLVRLQSVRLAGRDLGATVAAVDPTGHAADANVGVALLRRFVLTIDFPGNAIWLDPVQQSPTKHQQD